MKGIKNFKRSNRKYLALLIRIDGSSLIERMFRKYLG